MTRKTIFILMTIYMFGTFIGGSFCMAAEMEMTMVAQIKSQDLTYNENGLLTENPSEDTYHPKCILSENTNEDHQYDVAFIKLIPITTVTFCKHSISHELVERSKLKIDGLLKGNMPGVYSVSRTILFHRLQINF